MSTSENNSLESEEVVVNEIDELVPLIFELCREARRKTESAHPWTSTGFGNLHGETPNTILSVAGEFYVTDHPNGNDIARAMTLDYVLQKDKRIQMASEIRRLYQNIVEGDGYPKTERPQHRWASDHML